MAFIDTDNENPNKYASFYNVGRAVGYGCPNVREDVLLVQFFLLKLYTDVLPDQKPKGNMTVDGTIGPVTRNWILKFQLDLRNAGKPICADGIVTKAGNPNNKSNLNSSITHTNYTIRWLNTVINQKLPHLYKTLPYNQEVPGELRLAFVQMHAEGPPMFYND